MQLTILVEPSRRRPLPFEVGPERYERFAAALTHYAGAPVRIVSDYLRNAPTEGILLLDSRSDLAVALQHCRPATRELLSLRIVLLGISALTALEQLERHVLPAAVDALRFAEWMAGSPGCVGPFGHRLMVEALGVECVGMPSLVSEHYCLLQSERHQGLPHLLADYLSLYSRTLDKVLKEGAPSVPSEMLFKAV